MSLLARIRKSASERITRNVSLETRKSRLSAPVASFSFDDVPRSAMTSGAAIIEAAGGRATYFVAGTFCGKTEDGIAYFDRDDLRSAYARGHEIGCHTYDHMRIVFEKNAAIDGTLKRNQDFVRETLGDVRLSSFAYPFGHVNLRSKHLIGDRFAIARGINPGVNAGSVDMAQIKATPLESRSFGSFDFDALVSQATANNGWLVFFGHDVQDDCSAYGITPAQLQSVVDKVKAAGIEILPVKSAAARVVFG